MPEAKRSDWKTQEMPEKNESFPLEMDLTRICLLILVRVPVHNTSSYRPFRGNRRHPYRGWNGGPGGVHPPGGWKDCRGLLRGLQRSGQGGAGRQGENHNPLFMAQIWPATGLALPGPVTTVVMP